MKAWEVRDNDEGNCKIVFSNHGLEARRLGADAFGLEFDEVECRRAKYWDERYGTEITMVDLFNAGWWFNCQGCDREMISKEDNPGSVATQNAVYCSSKCSEVEYLGKNDFIVNNSV